MKVLAIERKAVTGGGLSTLEDPRHPGLPAQHPRLLPARHHHDAVVRGPRARAARRALHRAGAQRRAADRATAGCWRWWTDIERTAQSFEQFSRKDAETLRRWHHEFVPIVQDILAPEAKAPPLPPDERRRLLERSAAGRRLLEVSALSPLEFVQQEFEHPTVRAGLLFFNGLREVDLRVRGFGHHIAALLASPAKAQMSRGGTVGAGARARGGRPRKRRRVPPDDGTTAHRRRGRPRRRRRDDRGRVHPRAAFRRLVAQSAPDLSRSAR